MFSIDLTCYFIFLLDTCGKFIFFNARCISIGRLMSQVPKCCVQCSEQNMNDFLELENISSCQMEANKIEIFAWHVAGYVPHPVQLLSLLVWFYWLSESINKNLKKALGIECLWADWTLFWNLFLDWAWAAINQIWCELARVWSAKCYKWKVTDLHFDGNN